MRWGCTQITRKNPDVTDFFFFLSESSIFVHPLFSTFERKDKILNLA